ncbi:pyruvate,orthophosphate dikinase [Actinoplanes lutulentus]|uniref:Pyruvate,phosphate dikinase n=1 Tax=Actinoplanes lutulentus TaxID=1287878 RepID=A0A327ZCS1_9ACTN|nr:PEP/pyruvate-binding domain-containing protein [Actinoplanes lutulentus]MBB2942497.1 pyruvate,orthophosphate dikinase [Actinoplanes lutulentus]RAK38078.1 pyruvate,phosphate dikinase [Actinoplanes lutulentus]
MRSAKEEGLIVLRELGLPVPPWFAIDPGTPEDNLKGGFEQLGVATVSVRSGARVSMPGMMTTVLDVREEDLEQAVRTVIASWGSPRAVTYREIHGIPHDLGTSVIVQAMVFGDRDERSGSGVAFSRDPNTGERELFGEFARQARGDVVVAGESDTLPLTELADEHRKALADALDRAERHYRDVCHVEFTIESGRLWLLQVRAGGLSARAAVRVAVDLADEGLIDRAEAVRRVTPRHVRFARTPAIRVTGADLDVIARGRGASPGVVTGRIAVTSEKAARMAVAGPVVLIRPHTSPQDMRGLAASAGVVTARGGPASHAAVVARSMGKPAVVQAGVSVETSGVRVNDRTFAEGTTVTIDGTTGLIVLGEAPVTNGEIDDHLRRLLEWGES